MFQLSFHRSLNESDFSFFYHLEQISGKLLLNEIPATTRIVLPNLRIIRGEEILGAARDNNTLAIINVNAREIILPKLTEITRGDVLIIQPLDNPICNWARVNWGDILDNGNIINSFQECVFESKYHSYINNVVTDAELMLSNYIESIF